MTFSPGARLDAYEIVRPLGSGGMGEVWLATEVRLGRKVALKVLPADLTRDSSRVQRFEQEARAASALNHPNVCTIHAVGETADGQHYIAMEYVDGETLRQRLSSTRLSFREGVEIAIQVAAALSAAHAAGIVHRDIKPENVMVRPDGFVKVLDFGLAKLAPTEVGGADTTRTVLQTEAGMLVGTTAYMSPEQARGDALDARSDIFSFGCVLYEMAAGHVAFSGGSVGETMAAILRDAPREMSDSTRSQTGLDRVIMRCLAKRPEERFQSARDLGFALKEILSGKVAPAALRGAALIPPTVHVWRAGVALIALGVLFILVRDGKLPWPAPSAGPTRIQSIAVLPLENLSSDPQQDYFADGMTEELISTLARFSALRVPSRTSVMRYKGSRKSLPEIAQELNVDAVLTGAILRSGDRVRITAQLIAASTDQHLWSESYERNLRDILTLQNEVAQTIANKIQIRVAPQEKSRLRKVRPIDPAAHEAYLRGRFLWNKRGAANLMKGIEYFQKAIDVDPTYALAYVGLADCYNLLGSWESGALSPKEAVPKAISAARKALEVDDTLGEAHASLGYAKQHYEWDWEGAEHELKRSIGLNPAYTNAHHWASHLYMAMGRVPESLQESRKGLEIDPLDFYLNVHLGWHYVFAREPDHAIEQFRAVHELDRNNYGSHLFLAWAYAEKGDLTRGTAEAVEATTSLKNAPVTLSSLSYMYAISGRRTDAQRILQDLLAMQKQRYVSSYEIGVIYLGLGQSDRAFEWFDRAVQERSGWLSYLDVEPRLDGLRKDPRFAALRRQVGLPTQPPIR